LFSKSDGPRLPKCTRQDKADKARATVDDIVKVVLNPNVQLPQFYAVNLTRLRPVAPTHCDISLLLREIQSLHCEVQALSHMRAEIGGLREQVKLLSQRSQFPPTTASASAVTILPALSEDTSAGSKDEQHEHHSGSGTGSFASLTKLAANDPAASLTCEAKRKTTNLWLENLLAINVCSRW